MKTFVTWVFMCFVTLALAGCSETPKPTEIQTVALASPPAMMPTALLMPMPDSPLFNEEAVTGIDTIDTTGYIKRVVEGKCLQINQEIDDCIWVTVIHGSSIFVIAGHSVRENGGDECSWNGSLFRFRRSDLKTDCLPLGELRNESPTAFSTTSIDGKFVVVGDSGTVLIVDSDALAITKSVSLRPRIKVGEAVVDSTWFPPHSVSLYGGVNTNDNDPTSFQTYPRGATWSATMDLRTCKITDYGVYKRTI